MSYYKRNRELARTRNTDPTETDQASARETDINVIVGRFIKTGVATGAATEPMYGDFADLPTDLRGYIEGARRMEGIKASLPDVLRNRTTEELLSLTPEQLKTILTPSTAPNTEPKE